MAAPAAAAGGSAAESEEEEEEETEQVVATTSNILLKKSSSRDYSRVMCETLTYSSSQAAPPLPRGKAAMNGSGAMLERQGSLRGSSNRYVAPKRSYFGHHLLGCFPTSRSSKTRSSLGLIPKLVLADHGNHGAAAVAEMMMVASGGGGGAGNAGGSGATSSMRCGSTKGGPSFSRVPADSARGSYSEPTSPQVTCIGQVKVRSSSGKKKVIKPKSKGAQAQAQPSKASGSSSSCAVSSSYCRSGAGVLLLRSKSKRSSISSPLASPARLTRSNSSRKRGDHFDAAIRAVEECARAERESRERDPESSYEIDLTEFGGRESSQDGGDDRPQPAVAGREESEEEEEEAGSDSRSNSPAKESKAPTADVIAQHRQLAIDVCQALANSSSAMPDRRDRGDCQAQEEQEETVVDHRHAVDVCVKKAAALTLKRLDSLGSDPSPRACLWMRRSIGRPLALDLTRKHRRG